MEGHREGAGARASKDIWDRARQPIAARNRATSWGPSQAKPKRPNRPDRDRPSGMGALRPVAFHHCG
jgi:hypothetical protein